MKKFLFFAFAISAVAMISCSDNDENGDNNASDNGCLCTFKLNGVTAMDDMALTGDMWTATKESLNISTCSELETNYQEGYYSAYEVSCTSN